MLCYSPQPPHPPSEGSCGVDGWVFLSLLINIKEFMEFHYVFNAFLEGLSTGDLHQAERVCRPVIYCGSVGGWHLQPPVSTAPPQGFEVVYIWPQINCFGCVSTYGPKSMVSIAKCDYIMVCFRCEDVSCVLVCQEKGSRTPAVGQTVSQNA